MGNKISRSLGRKSSKTGSAHDPDNTQAAGFSKPRTASPTKITLLVNKTGRTLVLRDKIGPSYGQVRYTIEKNSQMEVSSVHHTFYKMLAYIVEEAMEGQEETGSRKSKSVFKDTMLSIDSDDLADYKTIVISYEDEKYKVEKFRV